MRKRFVLLTFMGLLMSFSGLLGGETKPHPVTIKGVITNLDEAKEVIASDTYLQLILDVPGGHKVTYGSNGRVSFDSDLPRIPVPAKGPKRAFSFDCKGLDEGTYVVAVQLIDVPNQTSVLMQAGGILKIQVSKDTGPTIDVGEVTVHIPRR
jgi:hypothetical protein